MELKHTILLCALLLIGCEQEQWDDCITSAGPMRSEERIVGDFHTIDLDDRVDLVVIEERADRFPGLRGGQGQPVGPDARAERVSDGTPRCADDAQLVRSFSPVLPFMCRWISSPSWLSAEPAISPVRTRDHPRSLRA